MNLILLHWVLREFIILMKVFDILIIIYFFGFKFKINDYLYSLFGLCLIDNESIDDLGISVSYVFYFFSFYNLNSGKLFIKHFHESRGSKEEYIIFKSLDIKFLYIKETNLVI